MPGVVTTSSPEAQLLNLDVDSSSIQFSVGFTVEDLAPLRTINMLSFLGLRAYMQKLVQDLMDKPILATVSQFSGNPARSRVLTS